jgi:hypothetical protein
MIETVMITTDRESDVGVRYQCFARAQEVATMLARCVQYCYESDLLQLLLPLLLANYAEVASTACSSTSSKQ